MKKVKRTSSFDSADRDVIIAVGESSQTDCAAFIEEQTQILNEFERLKGSALTHEHVTTKSNDERTHSAGLRRALFFPFKRGKSDQSTTILFISSIMTESKHLNTQ